MQSLGTLTNLEALQLSGSNLEVPGIRHFSCLTALQTLVAGQSHGLGCGNKLDLEAAAALLSVLPTCMTCLELQGIALNEPATSSLGRLTSLRIPALGPAAVPYSKRPKECMLA